MLLTPPEQGPRIKGQRIKLQDIIDGAYNPLTSNNGCWINRKYGKILMLDELHPLVGFCVEFMAF